MQSASAPSLSREFAVGSRLFCQKRQFWRRSTLVGRRSFRSCPHLPGPQYSLGSFSGIGGRTATKTLVSHEAGVRTSTHLLSRGAWLPRGTNESPFQPNKAVVLVPGRGRGGRENEIATLHVPSRCSVMTTKIWLAKKKSKKILSARS